MKLHCPACGSPIPAADVDLRTGYAKCARCDDVFAFAPTTADTARRPPVAPQVPLPRPPRMAVTDFGGDWSVRWRWFTPATVGLAVFCVAWDSFLVFWYSMAFTGKHVPWIMVVFPVAHVAVGVGLTYGVLTGFLNRTTVRVTGGELSVRHGPLPWPRPADLPSTQVEQLTTGQDASRTNNATTFSYSVKAVLADGTGRKVVGGLRSADEADWLRQQLEQRLRVRPGNPAP